jgi:integrase
MPRPKKDVLFELDGHYVKNIAGTPVLYHYWRDAGTGASCRETLGTTDLIAAQRKLAEIVVRGATKTPDSLLVAVLLDYFQARTDKLASKGAARAAGRLLRDCWGNKMKAGAITKAAQQKFATWAAARGHSLSYASRTLGVLAAALEHAGLPHKITYGEAAIAEAWPDIAWKTARRVFIPSDAELARFLSLDMPENLWRWTIGALNTGARPSAVIDLAPAARTRDARLLNLLPAGRKQNKKYRPTIRATIAHGDWLDRWEGAGLDRFGGKYVAYHSREGIKTAMRRARLEAQLPQLSVYSFRHKVATVLRLAGVPEDQIALQLGHRRPHLRTTGGYGEWDPSYLRDATAAIEAWWSRLQLLTDRPLFAAGIPAELRRAAPPIARAA